MQSLTGLWPVPNRGGGPLVLTVEAGQVVCPERGIVDIETCYPCRGFVGVADDRRQLCCAGRSPAPATALSVLNVFGATAR